MDAPAGDVLQALLRKPQELISVLQESAGSRLPWLLGIFALVALAAYGLVIGSFSGGTQWIAAPLKVSLGVLASVAICLPSLFIFASLSGAEITLRGIVGALSAVLALTALMLIGLAPVVWVFSQSTESVAFIGTLHLVFWLIAVTFGLRLLRLLLEYLKVRERLHLRMWTMIFLLVSLQMTTALRPLLGTSDRWFSAEKKFFAAYWIENVFGKDALGSEKTSRTRED
ncbi:MAG: hypothetical protein ACAI37_14880 [Chthoniobacter sp.]